MNISVKTEANCQPYSQKTAPHNPALKITYEINSHNFFVENPFLLQNWLLHGYHQQPRDYARDQWNLSLKTNQLYIKIQQNNQNLMRATQSIAHNYMKIASLIECVSDCQEQMSQNYENKSKKRVSCVLNTFPFFSNQALITKFFGTKQYKYKLSLNSPFPKVIYKQRNILLNIGLTNPDGEPIANANLCHLCISTCTFNGQWIQQLTGDSFIRGKSEVDLYQGEAEFKKISAVDVSRNFIRGVVNFIIYPKQTILKHTGQENQYQKYVNINQIEPIIIKNVVVKAKKKRQFKE